MVSDVSHDDVRHDRPAEIGRLRRLDERAFSPVTSALLTGHVRYYTFPSVTDEPTTIHVAERHGRVSVLLLGPVARVAGGYLPVRDGEIERAYPL